MLITVTGATGHVGANLVRALLDKGHAVRALIYVDGPALDGLDVEKCPGNVLDNDSLEKAFDGANTVYHLASAITLGTDPHGRVREINVRGVENVARACLRRGVRRLLHFSSVHALSPYPADAPVDETRPLALLPELPAYDRSKAEAEQVLLGIVEQDHLDAVIVNPTGIVGPNDFENSRMGRVLLDFRAERIPALIPGGFNWVDVRDVCAGAMAAAERGRTGERYLLGGQWHSMRQVAETVAEITGARPPRITCPFQFAKMIAPIKELLDNARGVEGGFNRVTLHTLTNHRDIDCSKAQRELSYSSRSFRDTVRDTFAWFDARASL